MKRIVFYTLLVISSITLFYSCDKTKTAQEYLREENNAIERYIKIKNISVVKGDFPDENHVWGENEYFRTADGLYIHVSDKGNLDNKITYYGQRVYVEFKYYYNIKTYVSTDDTASVKQTLAYVYFPFQFDYQIGNYTYNYFGYSSEYTDSNFGCSGWMTPLLYLGEGAVVDLIVPSSLGSSVNNQSYQPYFYGNLKYTKFK